MVHGAREQDNSKLAYKPAQEENGEKGMRTEDLRLTYVRPDREGHRQAQAKDGGRALFESQTTEGDQ